jgi:hypothetical protein
VLWFGGSFLSVTSNHPFMLLQYPTLYAADAHSKSKEFNCVQRAHQVSPVAGTTPVAGGTWPNMRCSRTSLQNSLENLPTFYALLLTAGVKVSSLFALLSKKTKTGTV